MLRLGARNLSLVAHAMKLASDTIGLVRQWLSLPEMQAVLRIPAPLTSVFPFMVDYPATRTPAVARKAQETIARGGEGTILREAKEKHR